MGLLSKTANKKPVHLQEVRGAQAVFCGTIDLSGKGSKSASATAGIPDEYLNPVPFLIHRLNLTERPQCRMLARLAYDP